jgi:hypothetical protein
MMRVIGINNRMYDVHVEDINPDYNGESMPWHRREIDNDVFPKTVYRILYEMSDKDYKKLIEGLCENKLEDRIAHFLGVETT